MAVKVVIPVAFRNLTGNKASVETSGDTLMDIIDNLDREFPGLKERLCDETGKIKKSMNVYLNREDIRYLNGIDSKVNPEDEIYFLSPVSGG